MLLVGVTLMLGCDRDIESGGSEKPLAPATGDAEVEALFQLLSERMSASHNAAGLQALNQLMEAYRSGDRELVTEHLTSLYLIPARQELGGEFNTLVYCYVAPRALVPTDIAVYSSRQRSQVISLGSFNHGREEHGELVVGFVRVQPSLPTNVASVLDADLGVQPLIRGKAIEETILVSQAYLDDK